MLNHSKQLEQIIENQKLQIDQVTILDTPKVDGNVDPSTLFYKRFLFSFKQPEIDNFNLDDIQFEELIGDFPAIEEFSSNTTPQNSSPAVDTQETPADEMILSEEPINLIDLYYDYIMHSKPMPPKAKIEWNKHVKQTEEFIFDFGKNIDELAPYMNKISQLNMEHYKLLPTKFVYLNTVINKEKSFPIEESHIVYIKAFLCSFHMSLFVKTEDEKTAKEYLSNTPLILVKNYYSDKSALFQAYMLLPFKDTMDEVSGERDVIINGIQMLIKEAKLGRSPPFKTIIELQGAFENDKDISIEISNQTTIAIGDVIYTIPNLYHVPLRVILMVSNPHGYIRIKPTQPIYDNPLETFKEWITDFKK